jgi:hypothetical protein
MNTLKILSLASFIAVSAGYFGACSRSEEDKGTMEQAGKALDESMAKAKERTGEAMERAGDAIKDAGQRLRENGEKSQKQ